jgi:hypothetical protein
LLARGTVATLRRAIPLLARRTVAALWRAIPLLARGTVATLRRAIPLLARRTVAASIAITTTLVTRRAVAAPIPIAALLTRWTIAPSPAIAATIAIAPLRRAVATTSARSLLLGRSIATGTFAFRPTDPIRVQAAWTDNPLGIFGFKLLATLGASIDVHEAPLPDS